MNLQRDKIDLKKCVVFSNSNDSDFENKTIGQKNYITDFLSLKKDIGIYVKGGLDVFLFGGKYSQILKEFLLTKKEMNALASLRV